jgi:hypothetical protein
MNDLQRYFETNKRNLMDKFLHYFDIYDRFFSRYRNTDVHFVEIGVFHGGSLQMWKEYFGPRAKVYGVDINPACKKFEESQIKVLIGDQADRTFLKRLTEEIPRIDILVDDGGHFMDQQINAFEVLYPHISPEGIYLCEDLHTSYWGHYGGGFKARGTFIEYSKYLVDYLNAWHCNTLQQPEVTNFTKSTYGLHYYDSVLVIEKKPVEKPVHRQTGAPSFPSTPKLTSWERVKERVPQLASIFKHKLGYKPLHRRR